MEKLTLIPSPWYLVMTLIVEVTTTAGWFNLGSEVKERPSKAIVYATAHIDWVSEVIPSETRGQLFNKWDIVFFKKYVPEEIELNGITYLVIKESDIIARLRPSEAMVDTQCQWNEG